MLPPLQILVNLTIGPLRRSSATVNKLGDRYSRRRRESWWTSVMGPKQTEFTARETFRR